MLKPKTSLLLSTLPHLKHGFFTRNGGASQAPFDSLNLGLKKGEDPQHVLENKQRVEAFFNKPLVLSHQVHGNHVARIDHVPPHPFTADGMVYTGGNLALGVLTADCVPVLWADPITRTIAVSHAGWRGTLAGILQQTRQHFKHPPYVAIGPSIQQASYEVGPDVYQAFAKNDTGALSFMKPHKDLYLFDLPGYVYNLIKTLDIAAIDWIRDDTYALPTEYFSCRRSSHQNNKAFGNMVSAIGFINH